MYAGCWASFRDCLSRSTHVLSRGLNIAGSMGVATFIVVLRAHNQIPDPVTQFSSDAAQFGIGAATVYIFVNNLSKLLEENAWWFDCWFRVRLLPASDQVSSRCVSILEDCNERMLQTFKSRLNSTHTSQTFWRCWCSCDLKNTLKAATWFSEQCQQIWSVVDSSYMTDYYKYSKFSTSMPRNGAPFDNIPVTFMLSMLSGLWCQSYYICWRNLLLACTSKMLQHTERLGHPRVSMSAQKYSIATMHICT